MSEYSQPQNSVTASGTRSVVAGSDISGLVVTGDVHVGGYERLDDVRQYTDELVARLDLSHFTGRGWLLGAIDEFLRGEDRGYFVLEADAGLGKTTFCAWLARSRDYPVHYVQISGGADPAAALKNLAAQLIRRYRLDEFAPDEVMPPTLGTPNGFARLLAAAAVRAQQADQPLVLVVDGLDEAPSRAGEMSLGLPTSLPSGTFLVVSRRPGEQILAIDAPRRYFTLQAWATAQDHSPVPNQQDMVDYLQGVAGEAPLAGLINAADLSADAFVGQLAAKCAGVWIYLRYVLEEMRNQGRPVSDLATLPDTLWQYYARVFSRSRQEDPDHWHTVLLPLLATLGAVGEPVTFALLCKLAGVPPDERWRAALDGPWRPFLRVHDDNLDAEPRYAVYHASLRDFLAGRLAVEALAQMTAERPLIRQLRHALADSHRRIAERYLSAWGGLATGLSGLGQPAAGQLDDGYGLRWLTSHLLAAGREDDLHHLLACSPHGRSVWFEAHDYADDVPGYLRDVGRARRSEQRLGSQLRYALIEASIASLSTSLPPALLGELVANHLWTASRAFSFIERMADEQQRAQALIRIASFLPGELAGRALSVAMKCQEPENRAGALTAVIPRLPDNLVQRALDVVLDLMRSAPYLSLEPMVAVISRLPRELLDTLHRQQAWIWALNRSRCVRAAQAFFFSDDRSDGARHALEELAETGETFQEVHGGQQGQFAAALLPHLPPDAFDDVLAALGPVSDLDAALTVLARHAPAERLGDLLDFAAINGPTALEFIRQVAPRLTTREIPFALRMCQAIRRDRDRTLAFAELVLHLDDGQARVLLAPGRGVPLRGEPPRRFLPVFPEAGQETSSEKLQGDYSHGFAITEDLSLYDGEYEYFAIGALLDRLPKDVARAAVTELVIPCIAKHATAYGTRADLFQFEHRRAFAAFAPYLSADQRRSVLTEIFTAMSFSRSDAEGELPFLARFAPLSEDEVATAFAVLASANPFSWWPQSAQMMADVLAFHVCKQVLERIPAHVTAFPVEQECFAALAALGQLQHSTRRDDTAARALAMAAKIKRPSHRACAVAELAPILLREDIAAEAFDSVRSIGPLAGLWAMDAMAYVLPPALLQAAVQKATVGRPITKPAKDIPRIVGRLAEIGDTAVIDSVLPHPNEYEEVTRLAPLLSASQARRIWSLADEESLHDAQAESLAALVSRLPEPERPVAVDKILAAYKPISSDDEVQARILGRLARAASTERLTRALREFLGREGTVKEWVLEELAPGLPEKLIEEALQYALSDDDDISCRALAKLAPRLSGALLNRAIAHVSDMEHERWQAVALTPLARQLPDNDENRETVLAMALEAAAFAPRRERLVADLIPELPERLRPRAVGAAVDWVCADLRVYREPSGEDFGRLNAVLRALRGPELEHLYNRLGEEQQVPRVRAAAEAAVIRQAGAGHAASFFAYGPPLYQDWPIDSGRTGLMDLIAAAAWWIHQHGEDSDIDDVIQAIFDVTRWWT